MLTIPKSPKHNANMDRAGELEPCIVCGKGIKNLDKAKWINTVFGSEAIMPHEEAQFKPGELSGSFPIGLDCLRRHPELKPYTDCPSYEPDGIVSIPGEGSWIPGYVVTPAASGPEPA